MVTRSVLAALLCAWGLLHATPTAWAASAPEAPIASPATSHFDSMRYFFLDPAKQPAGSRGVSYVNLIGGLDATTFLVYFEGTLSGLTRTRHRRSLRVFLRHAGALVGTVEVVDLSRLHGSVAVYKHVTAVSTAAMRDVDQVDARIEP